MSACIRPPAL